LFSVPGEGAEFVMMLPLSAVESES